MSPQQFCNAKSNHILLCGYFFEKSSSAATLCCNHQRYYQPSLNKGRVLDLPEPTVQNILNRGHN